MAAVAAAGPARHAAAFKAAAELEERMAAQVLDRIRQSAVAVRTPAGAALAMLAAESARRRAMVARLVLQSNLRPMNALAPAASPPASPPVASSPVAPPPASPPVASSPAAPPPAASSSPAPSPTVEYLPLSGLVRLMGEVRPVAARGAPSVARVASQRAGVCEPPDGAGV